MGRDVILLENEQIKQKNAIAEILRQVADKVERGGLTMKKEHGSFVVEFIEDITLDVKVIEEQKRKLKCSFNLEFFVAYHNQDSIVVG